MDKMTSSPSRTCIPNQPQISLFTNKPHCGVLHQLNSPSGFCQSNTSFVKAFGSASIAAWLRACKSVREQYLAMGRCQTFSGPLAGLWLCSDTHFLGGFKPLFLKLQFFPRDATWPVRDVLSVPITSVPHGTQFVRVQHPVAMVRVYGFDLLDSDDHCTCRTQIWFAPDWSCGGLGSLRAVRRAVGKFAVKMAIRDRLQANVV